MCALCVHNRVHGVSDRHDERIYDSIVRTADTAKSERMLASHKKQNLTLVRVFTATAFAQSCVCVCVLDASFRGHARKMM